MFLTDGKMDTSVFITLVIVGFFILALLVVGGIKLFQVIKKQIRRNKRIKNRKIQDDGALDIFGGKDNIIKTERQLNRILVEVVDKKMINFEILKQMNVGTQITGNIIKCSSEQLANSLENFKK